MLSHAAALVTVVFVWWFSTGLILCAHRLPRRVEPLVAACGALVALVSLLGLVLTRDMASASGAYLAFLSAIGVWAFNEMMFLSGRITGPRTTPAPAPGGAVSRLRAATETILYHELALAFSLALVALLTVGGSNRTGLATFVILWVMRLSAKLNVFLGVRNLSEEMLPAHLTYLETYFRRGSMNPLMPVSIGGGLLAAGLIFNTAWQDGASPYTVASATLTATLVVLAVVEHILMVTPVSGSALWRWARGNPSAPRRPRAGASTP